MAKIFISYSRKDIEFAKKLTGELQKSDLDFWVDWEGIPPTVDWMTQIEKGIEEADNFIFIISPDSIQSKICGEEIDHAVRNGKRLIPIVAREIEVTKAPNALSHLNWIFFRENDDFIEASKKLLTALQTDYEWAQTHSRLQVKALEWERKNREASFLLRGKDLQDAELQFATNSSKKPHPTDLQRDYVFKSRQAIDRQKRWGTVMVAVVAVLMFVLGIYGLREARRANENQQKEAIAKNHALAKEIELEINQVSALAVTKIDQNFSEALLLGVEAYRLAKDNQTINFAPQNAMTKILQSNPGLIQVLQSHTDWINVMAISPNGNILASGSWDATVILWDISNPSFPVKLQTLTEHTDAVEGLAFSSDGETLASAGSSNLILWDVSEPSEAKLLQTLDGYYFNLNFTPDNQTLAAIKIEYDPEYKRVISLLDVTSGNPPTELSQIETDAEAADIALHPDKDLLFAALDDGTIRGWDMTDPQDPKPAFDIKENEGGITSIEISADGEMLAAGDPNGTILLWDVSDPAAPVKLDSWSGHSLPITSLAFSADGSTLASSSDESSAQIILWNITNRNAPQKTRNINGHSLTITDLEFGTNFDILISGSRDGTLMLWDATEPKTDMELGSLESSTLEFPFGMAFKPNSSLLASWNSDGKLTVWNVSDPASPKQEEKLNEKIDVAVFNHDGSVMASSNYGDVVALWDTTDFSKISTIKLEDDYAATLEFSADGKTLIIIGAETTFWDITDPQKPVQITTLPEEINNVSGLIFIFAEDRMASIENQNIVLWDISDPASPAKLGVLEGHTNAVIALAFNPTNPNLAASASRDRTVILWNISEPLAPRRITTLGNHSDWVNTLSFSPDGTMLATGSDDKQINLWNIANPELPALISKMSGHSQRVNTVAFHPSGKFIASLGDDNRIVFWDINPESWAQKSCSIADRNLTDLEWSQFFPSKTYRQTCEAFPPTQAGTATLVPAPTAAEEAPAALLPVCTDEQTPACAEPAFKQLDLFCVDSNTYGLYSMSINTTFTVLTPGFTCVNEKTNSLGEPRISCTGPAEQEFQVSICNAGCANMLETSNQCAAGFGLNSEEECCAPLPAANSGCITQFLMLKECEE